jgi:branched-chain amino acid transport system ATP-binding protein
MTTTTMTSAEETTTATATATPPKTAATATGKTLLKVSGLKVGYGGIQAVKGVDFMKANWCRSSAPTAPARPPP